LLEPEYETMLGLIKNAWTKSVRRGEVIAAREKAMALINTETSVLNSAKSDLEKAVSKNKLKKDILELRNEEYKVALRFSTSTLLKGEGYENLTKPTGTWERRPTRPTPYEVEGKTNWGKESPAQYKARHDDNELTAAMNDELFEEYRQEIVNVESRNAIETKRRELWNARTRDIKALYKMNKKSYKDIIIRY